MGWKNAASFLGVPSGLSEGRPSRPPGTQETFLVHMYERTLSKCSLDTSFNFFPLRNINSQACYQT